MIGYESILEFKAKTKTLTNQFEELKQAGDDKMGRNAENRIVDWFELVTLSFSRTQFRTGHRIDTQRSILI